jgi:hypothetical protein
MERELDHPPAEPVILDEAHDRSLVGNRVIYEFRFSMGIAGRRLPRTVPATTKSVRVRGV